MYILTYMYIYIYIDIDIKLTNVTSVFWFIQTLGFQY